MSAARTITSDREDQTSNPSLSIQTRLLKRHTHQPFHILKSIDLDARFVQSVAGTLRLPLIVNLRCGRWYAHPKDVTDICYFKSTDGHYGKWDIPVRRLNLHLLPIIKLNRGIIIVDSTRRGKRFPDALSRTIPLWCALINALVFPSLAPTVHTLDSLVSPSEMSNMTSILLTKILPRFQQLQLNLPALSLPLRPVFLGPHSPCITRPDATFAKSSTYFPIYCLVASQVIENPQDYRQHGFVYIQGAADDEENWASGLTPELFWAHKGHFLTTAETCNGFLRSLSTTEFSLPKNGPVHECSIPGTPLVVGSSNVASPALWPWARFTHVINCTNNHVQYPGIDLNACQYLFLNIVQGKCGSAALGACFSAVESWYGLIHSESESGGSGGKPKVLIYCHNGLDLSVVITVMLLIKYHAKEVGIDAGTVLDKGAIRQVLLWLMNHYPRGLPTRASLKQLNVYLITRPFGLL